MGDKKYPILGTGTRPPGAVDCGLYRTSNKKKCPTKSYGMPSGHSQSALLFSTYNILNLIKNNNSNPLLYLINIFFAIFIPWSRVNAKVHTTQQTIVGSLLGIGLGYFFFNFKPTILKLIIK
jgi:membrane-associated phospholipid phosphatase